MTFLENRGTYYSSHRWKFTDVRLSIVAVNFHCASAEKGPTRPLSMASSPVTDAHRIVKDVQGTATPAFWCLWSEVANQLSTVHWNISCKIMTYTHTHVWMMFDVCKYKDIHLRYLGLGTTPTKKPKIFTQLWIFFPILFSPRVVTLESSDPALPLACQYRRWPPQVGWNSENPSDFGDCGAARETHHFWSSHFNMQNTFDNYNDRLEK